MGILVPADFDLSTIKNDDEARVVTALVEQLTDGWLIFPNVRYRNHRDYEIDVVLLHETDGIVVLEVKGHKVRLNGGIWYGSSGPLKPQPFAQAKDNAYKLREILIKKDKPLFQGLPVRYGVIFPNTTSFVGELPADIEREQLLLGTDLEDIKYAVDELIRVTGRGLKMRREHMEAVIDFLCPNAEFSWDPADRLRQSRQRMEALCASQVRALERLDANHRVFVSGGAGTGKTRLALAWARRAAFARGERVLVVCFNEPLADQIREFLGEDDDLVVGAFLTLAQTLEGMPYLEKPDGLSAVDEKKYWDETVIGHLLLHWPKITERFDTIIIDEAQDFSPAWIAQLEWLLGGKSDGKLLLVADAEQDIFDRGFRRPTSSDGWAVCELVNNCRNTHQIALMLRTLLGGAPSPQIGPESIGIAFEEVSPATATSVVGKILARQPDDGSDLLAPVGSIAVLVRTRQMREELRQTLGLGSWNERETKIVCETFRRMKGTEFDTVILVDPEFRMDDRALYIGISRAINQLFVVGPRELGERLRLVKPR